MNKPPSILFVGHSHVVCIAAAVRKTGVTDVGVINLLEIPGKAKLTTQKLAEQIMHMSPIRRPDALCLCMNGNDHNAYGVTENPIPFSLGDREKGCIPEIGEERQFISYRVMRDIFEKPRMRRLVKHVFDAFPQAARYWLCPPPPICDWAYITSNPIVFSDMIQFGPAPESLKKQLYRIQCDVLRDMALEGRATFIEPDSRLVEDGFLRPQYCADPTHGNSLYGEVMLSAVRERAGAFA
ncbi:hypothetical protein [Parvibaculum sp.]|uniref:hypothetical protein n=1 Tax=Parvibaculum sp. TaxID=2024848 RepID=UPI0032969473